MNQGTHKRNKDLSKSKLISSQQHPKIILIEPHQLRLRPVLGVQFLKAAGFGVFGGVKRRHSGHYKWGHHLELFTTNSTNHLKGILEGGRT